MLPSSPLSPSGFPSGRQALQTAPGARSLPAAEPGPRSSCWGLTLRDSATSARSRRGESASPKRRREGCTLGSEAGGLPLASDLSPHPGPANLAYSTCRRYLSRCVRRDCIRAAVGAQTTAAASKRGGDQPDHEPPELFRTFVPALCVRQNSKKCTHTKGVNIFVCKLKHKFLKIVIIITPPPGPFPAALPSCQSRG